MRNQIVPRLGRTKLEDIGPADLGAFYAELLGSGRLGGKRGLSPSTVRGVHATLHRAFRDGVALFKADFYSLSDKATARVHIEDLNDHYFSAGLTAGLQVSFEGILSVPEKRIEKLRMTSAEILADY